MVYQLNEKSYQNIQSICISGFKQGTAMLPLAEEIWADPDFPMHCPEHHYLVAAVLLSVYRRLKNDDVKRLKQDLETAAQRCTNILAGFCGWYGACGAAVGSGVFLSVLTDTTPYSIDTWGLVNRITAVCLSEIASLGGPRCCKRACFTALSASAGFMKNHMNLDAGDIPKIQCGYHDRNAECKKTNCPFYNGET